MTVGGCGIGAVGLGPRDAVNYVLTAAARQGLRHSPPVGAKALWESQRDAGWLVARPGLTGSGAFLDGGDFRVW